MSKSTTLAAGQITNADAITIELVKATDTPPAVLIRWPKGAERDRPQTRKHWPPQRQLGCASLLRRRRSWRRFGGGGGEPRRQAGAASGRSRLPPGQAGPHR